MLQDSEAPAEAPSRVAREAEEHGSRDRPASGRAVRERWPFWIPVAVLVLGLIVTGVLTWASRTAYVNNEKRTLRLRGREIGSVISEALPSIQTPLASAAALAVATNGDVRKIRQFIATYVGAPPRPFISASVWPIGAIGSGHLTTVGVAPMLRASSASTQAFFARAAHARGLAVIGFERSPEAGTYLIGPWESE